MKSKYLWFILISLVLSTIQADAQGSNTNWEVYIEFDIDTLGSDRVQFLNLQDGQLVTVIVDGERYTLFNNYVLFFDRSNQAVRIVKPDGIVEAHPFIQLGAARRVDWVVSEDKRLIAWTLTYDNTNGLTTVTTVSNPSGSDQNLVLSDGPRTDGARVLPVAFTLENQAIILDSQPDGIGDLAPYRQYASLFQLSLIDGSITPLVGEPSCFCAISLRAGRLVRLSVTSDFSGFDVNVYDLVSSESNLIQSIGLVNYTQGGNILISPDGSQAIYSLSQIELNSSDTSVRTVLMLVNLETSTQTQLTEPQNAYITPLSWTEDNTAVLITTSDSNGTFKVDLITGEVARIAQATFIGTLVL